MKKDVLWPDALPDANPPSGLTHYPLVCGHWGGIVFKVTQSPDAV